MQERLASRLLVHAEEEVVEAEARSGMIPGEVAESMLHEMARALPVLKGEDVAQLQVDAAELLRKVPFFRDTPPAEFGQVVDRLRPRTVPTGEVIIQQGKKGDTLYLIARGVVRVSRRANGREGDLATLLAGDFFGEMALLHRRPRTATCRAATPCALYELRRRDFDALRATCPALQAALEEADRDRKKALDEEWTF